jgi:ADP-L-glycero-D-manno-heptose 6-epimerase
METIFHMGACSSTTEKDAGYLMKNNYEYSKLLAQWAMESGTQFIYASSAATYGDGNLGYSDDDKVTPTLKPLNMYGYSKQLFDEWALRQGFLRRLTGFKFFNVFGPNEYHKGDMASVVFKSYPVVKSDQPLRLFKSYKSGVSDGNQDRDFIYVKDVVEVLWYAYKNPDLKGLFNLGLGKAHTWNDLGKALFKALGKTPKIEYIEMPETLKGKYQYHTQADMRKLFSSAKDFKFTPMEEAIKDYVQNYLEKEAFL